MPKKTAEHPLLEPLKHFKGGMKLVVRDIDYRCNATTRPASLGNGVSRPTGIPPSYPLDYYLDNVLKALARTPQPGKS